MKSAFVFRVFLAGVSLILINLLLTYLLARIFPPPKGSGFDGLDYVLKPFFFSLILSFLFISISLMYKSRQKQAYFLSLLLCFLYSFGLFRGLW